MCCVYGIGFDMKVIMCYVFVMYVFLVLIKGFIFYVVVCVVCLFDVYLDKIFFFLKIWFMNIVLIKVLSDF